MLWFVKRLLTVELNLFSLQLRGVAAADVLADEYGETAVVWTGVTTEDHKVCSSNYHDWYGDEPNNEGGNGI